MQTCNLNMELVLIEEFDILAPGVVFVVGSNAGSVINDQY
jgi:hypothetical protein